MSVIGGWLGRDSEFPLQYRCGQMDDFTYVYRPTHTGHGTVETVVFQSWVYWLFGDSKRLYFDCGQIGRDHTCSDLGKHIDK